MARPQDPAITEALLVATIQLLGEQGFAGLSLDAVARRAGAGRPAIYRRWGGKAELVLAAIQHALPQMRGDASVRELVDQTFPPDPEAYLAMLGALLAERHRHPQLIAAFRERILLPRRAIVRAAIEREHPGVDGERAVDLLAGPFLARAFAGHDVGPRWRRRHFERWSSSLPR